MRQDELDLLRAQMNDEIDYLRNQLEIERREKQTVNEMLMKSLRLEPVSHQPINYQPIRGVISPMKQRAEAERKSKEYWAKKANEVQEMPDVLTTNE